jgi:hypothetical protein
MVYGPSRDEDKSLFISEVHDLWLVRNGPLLFGRDFNMIYCAQDKHNDRINHCLMG